MQWQALVPNLITYNSLVSICEKGDLAERAM